MRMYLIGAGAIARTHAEASRKLSEPVELRVADPVDAVRAEFVAAYPDAIAFGTAEEMLGSEPAAEDDIVIVATPPFAHAGPTIHALESGRHVLCEKPLAMDVTEAEQMLAAAVRAGRLLGSCSVRYRGFAHTEAVRGVLASGELGTPYALDFVNRSSRNRPGIEYQPSSRWFLDISRSGGGIIMDWAPYDFSTLFDLFEPVRVEVRDAWTAKPVTDTDPEDVVFDVETDAGATLRLTTVTGQVIPVNYLRGSGSHATEQAYAELSGTSGAVRWNPYEPASPVFLRTDDNGKPVEREVPKPAGSTFGTMDHPVLHFAAAVRGRPSPASVGAIAVDEFHCVRAMYDCVNSGQPQVVEVRR